MRYLSNREQSPRRGPRGIWKHGKAFAICPVCRERIGRGVWVKSAPGYAGTIKHVACAPRGRR